LIQSLDDESDGFVDINRFLTFLRGTPNEKRLELIDLAFKKFDKDGCGWIDLRDLK
jgi:Ca2+-binding EF-hand superfamily protein